MRPYDTQNSKSGKNKQGSKEKLLWRWPSHHVLTLKRRELLFLCCGSALQSNIIAPGDENKPFFPEKDQLSMSELKKSKLVIPKEIVN
jgi:hypothetical protein